jgi:hypothetical protein
MWLGFASLTLLPGKGAVSSVTGEIDMMAAMTPGWLARLDSQLSGGVGAAGMTGVIGLALLCGAIGLAAVTEGRARVVAAIAGIAVAVVAGLVGQAFGEIFSGRATDPGSAPLLILFALCLLGVPRLTSPEPTDANTRPIAAAVTATTTEPTPVLTRAS